MLLRRSNLLRSVEEGADSYLPKEEMANIAIFLNDVLEAHQKGQDPWEPWQNKLPTSYFEKRWGVLSKDTNQGFWDQFKASLKERKKIISYKLVFSLTPHPYFVSVHP